MGQMIQEWSLKDIEKRLSNVVGDIDMDRLASSLVAICQKAQRAAKDGHSYNNYKGQLESSIGYLILKDRRIVKWDAYVAEGTAPEKGIMNASRFANSKILGKARLPDGTRIPLKGVIGVVFAAAPYAKEVESYGRKVLIDFMPSRGTVYNVIKTTLLK